MSVKSNNWPSSKLKYKRSQSSIRTDGDRIHLQGTGTDIMLLMPVQSTLASLLLASSRSQSLIEPLAAPATTTPSAESKVTDSTGLVWPAKLYKHHPETTSLLVSWQGFWQSWVFFNRTTVESFSEAYHCINMVNTTKGSKIWQGNLRNYTWQDASFYSVSRTLRYNQEN